MTTKKPETILIETRAGKPDKDGMVELLPVVPFRYRYLPIREREVDALRAAQPKTYEQGRADVLDALEADIKKNNKLFFGKSGLLGWIEKQKEAKK